MTIAELIAELQKQDPNATVVPSVAWAGDCASADDGVHVKKHSNGVVVIGGWLANCDTTLEIGGYHEEGDWEEDGEEEDTDDGGDEGGGESEECPEH